MEDLELRDLTRVINDYLKDNYSYEYADVFDDEIDIHFEDRSMLIIKVRIYGDREETFYEKKRFGN